MKYTLFILGIITGSMLIISCSSDPEQATGGTGSAEVSEAKLDSLINLMTLDEKLDLIHASSSFTSGGVPRLDIPELVFSDGPHGVRHEHGRGWYALEDADDEATYLPVGICLASTWNKDLGYDYGEVLGNEAKERGKNVLLGPGINIIRSPLNGRNFEYLSEDPFLTGVMGVGYVKGLQAQGVAACPKHYTANNQETDRHNIDALISKRALHEIYLPAFKAVVQDGGAWSIMGAYNKVNGQYTTHHEYLNSTVLKGDWEFDGVVVSDWASVKNTREALLYGTDIEMGTELLRDFNNPVYEEFYLANPAKEMIENGDVDESFVDDKVKRVLRLMYRTTALTDHGPGKRNVTEHQQKALEVAREGIVLLKNDGLLPLEKSEIKTLAVIGHNANRLFAGRGGSSQVNAFYEITPLEGIRNLVGDDVEVVFAEGYEPYYDESLFRGEGGDAASQSRENREDVELARTANEDLIQEAVALAEEADAVIFVGGWIHGHEGMPWGQGTYDAEARDKLNLKLIFGQEELIRQINSVNDRTAVVLMGGSNVEMENWLPDTPAYLHAWYPGMEGGTAIAEILFGEVNPSGKLPMTFANSHEDYPSHSIGEFPGDGTVDYAEDIYVGYRYFDTQNKDVFFPFGFGLTYTTFEFSDLQVSKQDDKVMVEATVTNTGDREGAEVVQIYVHHKDPSVDRPIRELKGFEKVDLEPGASATVNIELDESAFMYYHPEDLKWVLESGSYEIQVGNSSRDIKMREEVIW
ncbi:beta-glucosidase family protein [Rhodohalobacter sp.]|uniref:beta-glucosidase family protein n=1 Tax=Rhodohalobacter sp. TaxID=1974210 RepID=UPI002ACE54EA|nr:glycoside hydrolase family 3 C-terminal domain-containing protein [Rhodohalobacter sp.]MDZ7754872.1 glycoside hydrolase family 3 C-terminal domain-containing protein [Rhodohalobacter sp.]